MNAKAGRNDACICGSGKKYKRCCGAAATVRPATKTPLDYKPLFALYGAGRHRELETAAGALIEQHGAAGLLWKLLAASRWAQGKEAVQAFEQAAILLPDDPEAHTNLGNVLRACGRPAEAAASHRRAIAINRGYAEAHNNLGSVLRDLGQLDEAISCFRQALALKPEFALAHNNMGIVLLALGRPDEAAASYRRALVMQPGFADAHANLADALQRLGRVDEAAAAYRSAIAASPRYVEAHMNLGALLASAGRLDEAAASYRAALALRPGLAEAHNNLANVLRELGLLHEAAASYRQALMLEPENAEIHNNLGNALFDLGDPTEAVQCYTRAVEIKPDYAKAHSNLGSALRESGRLDEAESSYGRALALEPGHAEVHTNLGIVQRLLGRAAEADASAQRALDINPQSAAALIFFGELHTDKGLFAEAQALYQRAIALDPDSPQAWAGIAGLRKMTPADQDWVAEAQRLVARRLRPRDEVQLLYSMGKYFDDVRDYEQAFAHYRRANELTKTYRPPHDQQHLTWTFDLVTRLYDRDWVQQVRPNQNLSRRPAFIVGTPRSGTSLAEQILASHPAAFGAGELSFWKTASPLVAPSAFTGASSADDLRKLAGDYLELLSTHSADASRVIDKMPANFAYLGLIHAALPNARVIHMRRNPIDTCLSIYFQNFHIAHSYANDLDDLAHFYTEYRRIMDHWRTSLPVGTLLEVPYEELVADQETWSRRMLEFIDLPWDPACLDFHRTTRSVSTFSKWQVRQKIANASVERWRHYEQHVGPLMRLIGAEPRGAAN